MEKKFLIAYLFFLIGFATSCDVKTAQSSRLEISPTSAHSGEMVFVKKTEGAFSNKSDIQVSISNADAPVVDVSADGLVKVLVPNVKAGSAKVQVKENKEDAGAGTLTILEAAAEQLLLEMSENGELKVIRKKDDSGDLAYHFAHGDIQLNFDLTDGNGNVIYSGSIPHPQKTGMEIFEDPNGEKIHREAPMKKSVVFPIRIPKTKGAELIRFYEAGPDMDLTTAKGREERTFISEIKLR
jgi:hypothetical protein